MILRPVFAIEPAPRQRDSKSTISFVGSTRGRWQSLHCRRAGTAAMSSTWRRGVKLHVGGAHMLEQNTLAAANLSDSAIIPGFRRKYLSDAVDKPCCCRNVLRVSPWVCQWSARSARRRCLKAASSAAIVVPTSHAYALRAGIPTRRLRISVPTVVHH
jgi:hypothetical protein